MRRRKTGGMGLRFVQHGVSSGRVGGEGDLRNLRE